MRLYYITRTYPSSENGGGGIIRLGTVTHLRNLGYEVWIVTPNNSNFETIIDHDLHHILIPIKKNQKFQLALQHFGLVDDYLKFWAKDAFNQLNKIIKSNDIVFVTSGGEMGTIYLGRKLKESKGCKLVLNLHDPISYTKIDGKFPYKGRFFHVSRDRFERENFETYDAIITSSIFYKKSLQRKYPKISDKIYHNHFGYIKPVDNINFNKTKLPLNIVYGGSFGKFQAPELLAEVVSKMKNVSATFIGDFSSNKSLMSYEVHDNINFISKLPQEEYINYLLNNVNIGFLSLKGDIANYCIPSKLYEYINVGLPILAAIEGDAKSIIEDNEYGIVSKYEFNELTAAVEKFQIKSFYDHCLNNILKDKIVWSMDSKIKEVDEILKSIS